ncbi:glycosyltransferase family 4 protein, partial [candidate division WOR-3 bacterium]|nr:glycosyltransferase family 4 protein [candidate division WOR-3 bacterium]
RMMLDRTDLPLPARWLGFYWVERLERRALALADAIIDTNATRARRFAPSRRQPVLVPNFPRVEDLPTPAATREPCFAFTGLASRHRGFDVLLRALALVVAERPEARLRVVGGFDPRDDLEEWTRCFARLHGIAGSLELYGWLPYRQMFEAIRSCCVGLILFQPRRANDYTGQPNKLFEFMGSGLAVIAPDFPETGPVVRRTGCGWLVDPTRPEAIAAAMAEALAEPVRTAACAESGRRAVLQRYNWARAEEALLQLYGQLSGSA